MTEYIRRTGFVLLTFFVILILNVTYWQIYRGPELAGHPRNKRLAALETEVARGTIFDRNGQAVAESREKKDEFYRFYPFGEAMAHITGYSSINLGKTGLEAAYNAELLGFDPLQNDPLLNWRDKEKVGNNLYLTIDSRLQELGQRLLAGKKGAIVALHPITGEVYALVTNPSFDPNRVEEQWAQLSKDEKNTPLLSRALSGMYPPGSTFKLITGAAAWEAQPSARAQTVSCPGYIDVDSHRINDNAAHGQVDFRKAIEVSCNTFFATMGLELKAGGLYDAARRFLLGSEIPFELPVKKSFIPGPDDMNKVSVAESSFGQGKILSTPMQMALVSASIANNGNMPRPLLVGSIKAPGGGIIKRSTSATLTRTMEPATAAFLTAAMVDAVEKGTGRAARISGVKVAGKTGTAENPHGPPHAWFVGFAPAEKPVVAVAVIIENAGYGGREAAPVARSVMEWVLNNRGE